MNCRKESESGELLLSLPEEDFKLTAKHIETGEIKELSASELNTICSGKTASDYTYKNESFSNAFKKEEESGWHYTAVSERAKIAGYEESVLFRMPKGEYEGFSYYLPVGLVKENDNGSLRLSLPNDFVIKLTDNKTKEKAELSAEEFLSEIKGKTDEDYVSYYGKPSEQQRSLFMERETVLRTNLPEEMLSRPNWCIVRTKFNEEKGRLDKYLIDCHTGKFAKSDDSSTWTDFDTACNYAKENGGETLAYVLEGKDNICCIDLDNCFNEKGEMSELAKEVVKKSGGNYCEQSISGKGVHLFGKTNGMDLRTFSRDGDLEFYQKTHIIAVTGIQLTQVLNYCGQ